MIQHKGNDVCIVGDLNENGMRTMGYRNGIRLTSGPTQIILLSIA